MRPRSQVLDQDAADPVRDVLEPVHHLLQVIVDVRPDDEGHRIGARRQVEGLDALVVHVVGPPFELDDRSVSALRRAAFWPIARNSGTASLVMVAASRMISPISRIGASNRDTSKSCAAFAVFCIWSMVSSRVVTRSWMSLRSKGVMKVRRTAFNVSRVISSAASSCSGDRRRTPRNGVTAFEEPLEGASPLDERCGMAVEEPEEAILLRHQRAKPTQHVLSRPGVASTMSPGSRNDYHGTFRLSGAGRAHGRIDIKGTVT